MEIAETIHGVPAVTAATVLSPGSVKPPPPPLQAEADSLRLRVLLKGTLGEEGAGAPVNGPMLLLARQPKGALCELHANAGDIELVTLLLPLPLPELCQALKLNRDALPKRLLAVADGAVETLALPISPQSQLAQIARSLLYPHNATRHLPLWQQVRTIALLAAVLDIVSSGEAVDEKPSNMPLRRHEIARIGIVKAALDSRWAQQDGVDALARQAGMNRTRLRAAFKAAFGMTISQYRTKLRMDAAAELVRSSGFSVERISREVGYRDACNFITAYRRHFGITPMAQRRSIVS